MVVRGGGEALGIHLEIGTKRCISTALVQGGIQDIGLPACGLSRGESQQRHSGFSAGCGESLQLVLRHLQRQRFRGACEQPPFAHHVSHGLVDLRQVQRVLRSVDLPPLYRHLPPEVLFALRPFRVLHGVMSPVAGKQVAFRARSAVQQIVARTTDQYVFAGTADQVIVAGAADQQVDSCPAV